MCIPPLKNDENKKATSPSMQKGYSICVPKLLLERGSSTALQNAMYPDCPDFGFYLVIVAYTRIKFKSFFFSFCLFSCIMEQKRGVFMVKEEIWSVAAGLARSFFRSQPEIREENQNLFLFGSCRITITEMKPRGMGVWAAQRIRVHMEGEDGDVEAIYHRFFMQFLSTGG
jgi:hypothetical protein